MAFRIIGWTYEADIHCTQCAIERFGGDILDPSSDIRDREGNPVRPIYAHEETSPVGEWCGDCSSVVAEPWGTEDDL